VSDNCQEMSIILLAESLLEVYAITSVNFLKSLDI